MKPGIKTFLDVSTLHLTSDDVEILDHARDLMEEGVSLLSGTSVIFYEHGYIISTMSLTETNDPAVVESKLNAMISDGFSPELINLAKYAASEGGIMLRFDTDAPTLENFPTFEGNHFSCQP